MTGKFRYVGGTNKILTVDHDISFMELIVKLWDYCCPSMCLRCKLPDEDLDVLVHVMSDEDLSYIVTEYDHCREKLRIRAFLDDTVTIKV